MHWIIIGLLIMINAVLYLYVRMYKDELDYVNTRLYFIAKNETNLNVNLRYRLQEMNELASNINQLIEKYEKEKSFENAIEQDFREEITNISHDLRTPLTSIAGYIQMIESDKTPEHKKEEYYSIIKKRLDVIIKMLDEVFDYAQIISDEYTLDFEKTDIVNEISEVLSMYYYDFLAKKATPSIQLSSTPIHIFVNQDALTRVFQNIIKNYLDYGKEALFVQMREESDQVVIQFKNYAPQLNVAEVEKIFNRSYRLDKSRTAKSTGLGLAIVDNLMEKMDGTISARLEDSNLIIELIFKIY